MSERRMIGYLKHVWHACITDHSTSVEEKSTYTPVLRLRLRWRIIYIFYPFSVALKIITNHFSQDCRDAKVSAKCFVARSLVQVRRDGGYLVHDLILDFTKSTIYGEIKEAAMSRQAQYLGRLDVLKVYRCSGGKVNGDYFSIAALWRSLEDLSGDQSLEAKTYNDSLEVLKQSGVDLDVARSFDAVASLFLFQVS